MVSSFALASPQPSQAPGMMSLTWNITHGWAQADEGRGVAVGEHGSVYFAGETRTFGAGNEDAFLLRADLAGGEINPPMNGGGGSGLGAFVGVGLAFFAVVAITLILFFRRRGRARSLLPRAPRLFFLAPEEKTKGWLVGQPPW